MKENPDYEKKYLAILKQIVLQEAESVSCGLFLFGSRAKGSSRFGSDYDLGVTGLAEKDFLKLKYSIVERVEESLVPWNVDLVNFDTASDRFRKIAMENIQWWKKN